ncbi:hypothetical protein JKP88DRAFT_254522 [Tribonema minus]|uniref:Uncharacterized protein n=1 Tax=Tribonema minus TaxID=303371 RepID=A0A835Z7X7_9STRA|nr:hypothetical protein JKP88DRAFT_254522 [Tribonema minus]
MPPVWQEQHDRVSSNYYDTANAVLVVATLIATLGSPAVSSKNSSALVVIGSLSFYFAMSTALFCIITMFLRLEDVARRLDAQAASKWMLSLLAMSFAFAVCTFIANLYDQHVDAKVTLLIVGVMAILIPASIAVFGLSTQSKYRQRAKSAMLFADSCAALCKSAEGLTASTRNGASAFDIAGKKMAMEQASERAYAFALHAWHLAEESLKLKTGDDRLKTIAKSIEGAESRADDSSQECYRTLRDLAKTCAAPFGC